MSPSTVDAPPDNGFRPLWSRYGLWPAMSGPVRVVRGNRSGAVRDPRWGAARNLAPIRRSRRGPHGNGRCLLQRPRGTNRTRRRLPAAFPAPPPQLPLGGVLIAERHAGRGDEHQRMLRKQDAGCEFFVSQICYDLDHTRDLLSDYAYTCRDQGIAARPVVVTLAPCGSTKTLEFLTWLGIDVPRWMRNDIVHSGDPLQASYEQCRASARMLIEFCRRLELPFGINIESVTNRKVEIEASVELAKEVRTLLRP